jgi:hypothetical protein
MATTAVQTMRRAMRPAETRYFTIA